MNADQTELDRLQEALRTCQLELAQVRAEQEPLMEERAEALSRLATARRELTALSRAVNDLLVGLPAGSDLTSRARRFVVRRRRERLEEWPLVELLRASELFNGPWYLRRHPQVVTTGLPPALHYLRHGATEGLDPGPSFSTTGYLAAHPDVAASGTNPLVHHLQHGGGATSQQQ